MTQICPILPQTFMGIVRGLEEVRLGSDRTSRSVAQNQVPKHKLNFRGFCQLYSLTLT